MLGSADTLLFEGFRLDRGGLFRLDDAGNPIPVPLGSRALDLLGLLAGRQGELISKDEIMAAVWPRTVVEENNLTVQIAALRRILDAGRAQGSCIQNVPGRGYRFAAPVTRVELANAVSIAPAGNSGGAVLRMPRLSIVVLPFANLSNDPEQGYLADGVTDDLTSDLSRIPASFVISRSTAFAYKGRQVGAKQIGLELGVRYLLEGSVRRSGGLVRVNVQLIDTESGAHLWAERFDRDISDLLRLQDEITRRTAVAVGSELVIAEASRPTDHPDALHYFFRARAAWSKPPTRQNYAEVINLFECALALDSRSAEIQSWLARALVARVFEQLTDSVKSVIGRAEALVEQALAASRVVRLRITPGATCCVRKAGTRKLLPNTRL